jgi:hypothetical protein
MPDRILVEGEEVMDVPDSPRTRLVGLSLWDLVDGRAHADVAVASG